MQKIMRIFGTSLIVGVLMLSGSAHAQWDETFGVKEIEDTIILGQDDVRSTVSSIINTALSLLGIVALGIVLMGGFYWMTAGGNEEQIGKAKGWIFSGVVGIAIILSAFAISRFVLQSLAEATALEAQ